MINRRKRTEILIKSDTSLASKFANEIREKYKVENALEPGHGLVMIKMRETAKKELFYLGEVLVSEAKVYVEGTLGIGIVVGDKEQLAIDLAIIDAAYKRGINLDTWEEELCQAEKLIEEQEKIEEAKILKTKVNFSTMNV